MIKETYELLWEGIGDMGGGYLYIDTLKVDIYINIYRYLYKYPLLIPYTPFSVSEVFVQMFIRLFVTS